MLRCLKEIVDDVLTVSCADASCGGAHEGNESGDPCVRFGAVHCLNAGVREARSGVAPFGRA